MDKGARPDGERIAKLLARAGVASRREVERMIGDGRVALDGKVLDTAATIIPNLKGVTVDGKPVGIAPPPVLFSLPQAAGHADRGARFFRQADDLQRAGQRPAEGHAAADAGRAARLQHRGPAAAHQRRRAETGDGVAGLRHPRTYRARAFGDVSQAQLEDLIEGITIDGVRYGKIDANLERRTGRNQWIEMTLTEGKNREVRNVLEHLGLEVSRLMRTAYGPFPLGDLPRGAADEVRQKDVEQFRKHLSTRGGWQ